MFLWCTFLTWENPEEEKENLWNEMFHLVSCIPQNEMVVLVGDMNGHVVLATMVTGLEIRMQMAPAFWSLHMG